jgi:hypothetical protein
MCPWNKTSLNYNQIKGVNKGFPLIGQLRNKIIKE